ncbi:uncharacterized protein LOC141822208 [Curcuma longa]|uniref:uncharacterized protein LOC141822208 n=1 Tax=Curcuma longa TaxID=136217 RepID=UPI003D9EDF86
MKTWGNKRVLRCVSVNNTGEGVARCADGAGERQSSGTSGIGPRDLKAGSGDGRSAVDEVRDKLLVRLREAADRINLIFQRAPASSPSKGDDHETEAVPPEEAETEPPSSRAWKLRTRRRGARVPAAGEKRSGRLLRSGSIERSERPNFSVTLTRDEIDEDIYAVTGHRARRRPRKRPRVVQKQLDMLFPGSWLSEITAEAYKVPD